MRISSAQKGVLGPLRVSNLSAKVSQTRTASASHGPRTEHVDAQYHMYIYIYIYVSADIARRVGYQREDYWIPKRG